MKRVDRELAGLAALGVDLVLEPVHRDLAEDRGDVAVERVGEQREPRRRVGRLAEHPAEDDRLAEDRRRLGDRQRGRELEDALRARQRRVDAVAELVGHRQHVAGARGVVEHHVGVARGHRVGAERAAALAGRRRGVDVVAGEELGRRVAELARELVVALEHELAGVGVADRLLDLGDRRHPVVVGEPVEPEQLRLQPVPAAGDLVAADDRLDQRLDRLVGGLVGEVAGGEPVRVGAQPVLRRLVLDQRVEDEAARPQAGVERRVTASAVVARSSRSGDCRFESATISSTGSSWFGTSTVTADISSVNRRPNAERPVTPVSVRIFSSGSESRCGR